MAPVSMVRATRVWAAIGLNSFGGPAGQIAVMHREVVERRRWVDNDRFIHALNFCLLLPGPEAQQLATYLGWLMNGVRGGLIAGTLFVLPGAIVMLAISAIYTQFGTLWWIQALLAGVQAAVIPIVVQAMVRIGRRTLRSRPLVVISVAAFLCLILGLPFLLVIGFAALIGATLGRANPRLLGSDSIPVAVAANPDADAMAEASRARARKGALRTAALLLVLWLLPIVMLVFLRPASVFSQEATLFATASVISFGGAYAVLAFVAQQAVAHYQWISLGDMSTGLGLAETTPGPLILVLEFVGFLAAYRHPGGLPPLMAGTLGALLTLWVVFLPSFVLVFAGAPFVERLRHVRALTSALSGVGAAVVGVIGSLAVTLALGTFFLTVNTISAGPVRMHVPELASVRISSVLIAFVAAVLLFLLRWPLLRVLAACAGLGVLTALVGWS